MSNLAGKVIYKYAFRVEVFLKKFKEGDSFTLTSGKKVAFVYDKSVENVLRKQQSTRDVKFLDAEGNNYAFRDLMKTSEFGGKGAGSGTAKEDAELESLRKQIMEAKTKDATGQILIKVFRTMYEVDAVVSTPGNPKSDFHLIDKNGKEIVWISHKDGKGPKDFQQWGGISQKKEPKISSHPETKKFVEDLKKMFPDGLPRATTLYRKIKDNNLKMMSVYGNQYATRRLGQQNCSILLQGPVQLIKKNGHYELDANHVHYNGDSVDDGGFEPVFMAIYKGDRSDAGVKGTRIVISPIQGRKGKEFDENLKIT